MHVGEELRKRRIERRWRLDDVAQALGVTSATISRVERGLQEPSSVLLNTWRRLLAGELVGRTEGIQRRPRGALSSLAELFLADVKAGLNETAAGWREPIEVGLINVDLKALSSEVELDDSGRIRIASTSSLEPVKQARNILAYKATVNAEEQSLFPLIDKFFPLLWDALKSEKTAGAVLLAGLTMMVKTTTPLILDACLSLAGEDANCLLTDNVGLSHIILESLNIAAPKHQSEWFETLKSVNLEELIRGLRNEGEPGSFQAHQKLAHFLCLPSLTCRLGEKAVVALGAAWAAIKLLESKGGAILTDVGRQHLAKAFWEGIQIPREEVEAAWYRLIEINIENEGERLGVLLWSWPEVF